MTAQPPHTLMQHARMVDDRAASRVLVCELAQIQLPDDFDHEPRQMIGWQPLMDRGW